MFHSGIYSGEYRHKDANNFLKSSVVLIAGLIDLNQAK